MVELNRYFYLKDKEIIYLSNTSYYNLIKNNGKTVISELSNKKVLFADIKVEVESDIVKGITGANYLVIPFNSNGMFNMNELEGLIYIKNVKNYEQYEWTPDELQFKSLMSYALKQELVEGAYPFLEYKKLPFDKTNNVISGICKQLSFFPGLKLAGNNLTLYKWVIVFDVVNPKGFISLLFLKEGLKHEYAKQCELSIFSPNDDMRYILSGSSYADLKKVSMWVLFLYNNRISYKDQDNQGLSCGQKNEA